MEKLEHEAFVEQLKLEKIKLLFDLDKVVPVAIGFLGEGYVNKLFKYYMSFKKNKIYVYMFSFILLLTPLRFFIFLSLIYFGISHQLSSMSKKIIKNRMTEDKEFYDKMYEESVIAITEIKDK